MVGDHQKSRHSAAARMEEPEEQHPSGIRYRAFLCERSMFAFGVAVDVGNGGGTWIVQK
jgi:hypothetical protein